MNEIEKMYENAGIKKKQFCELFCCITRNDYECTSDCSNYEDNGLYYPPFTAKKQIELIKWLGKLDGKLEIFCTYNKEKFIFNFYFNRKTNKNPDPKYSYSNLLNEDFEILIASLINDLWQDLTEEEKEEIRKILKG